MSKTTREIAEQFIQEWFSDIVDQEVTTALERTLQAYGREERKLTLRELLEIAEHDEPDLVKGYIQGELGMTKSLDEIRERLQRKVN